MHVIWFWQWGQVNMRVPPYGEMCEEVGGRELTTKSLFRSLVRTRFGSRGVAPVLRSILSSLLVRRAHVLTIRITYISARFEYLKNCL
jgi:hypothetical protein